MNIVQFIIVCPLVFLAGFIDSIAGGGGLVSLPAYLLAGVPIHQALATNKFSSTLGTFVSTGRLLKNKCFDWKLALPSIPLSLVGSYLGSTLALNTSDEILRIVLLIVLPVVAFAVLKKKNFSEEKGDIARGLQYFVVCLFAFVFGMYDGFYGPGTGAFLLLGFTALAKMDVRTASGNVKLCNLSSNVAALVTFLLAGNVVFLLGGAAALFSIAGHYVGSGLMLKNGSKIVRPIVLIVLALLFIKIILGFFGIG